MSLDPLSFQAPSLVLPAVAYQTNFWANLASADHPYPSVMTSPHSTFNFMDRNNDALVVYDAKDNSNVAQCVMIAADDASSATSNATFLLSQNQVPSEYQLFGVSEAGFPSSFDLFKSNSMAAGIDRVQNVSKMPSNKAPTQRQQHYHHRHHAQTHHAQVNNQKNKTRFSATGLSSNYTIVRDSKMSLSSAPSSPTAGSVGGSLNHAYAGIHATPMNLPSNPYTVQCKDSSSYSSSYSSKNFKMSASSSLSSYSSCSSLSSTPSMNGISPRKRRADDTANNNKQIPCRKEYFQRNEGEIINLCSCETCTTDDVTARVDDVTLRDMISGEQEQRQKRSKNDDDVVFVSAEPAGTNHRVANYENQTQKERHLRKSRKSNKKVSARDSHIVQAIPAAALSDSKPFIIPSSLTIPPRLENHHQSNGRYFLRSTAKGRNQNKPNGAHASPAEDANGVPPTTCNYIQQTVVSPAVQGPTRMIDLNNNGNGRTFQPTTANSCQTAQTGSAVAADNTPSSPRYHTRSRQKKVKASAQASAAGPVSSQDNCPTAVPYYPASVIQSINSSAPCSSYATTTSSKTAPALDAVRESSTHTPSSSFKKIYDIHGIIGVGGGGTVYAGTRKSDGMQVAIKQVPKAKVKRWGKLNDRVVPIEFELLHRASHSSHKGIISMLDWYERRTTYILVMERPQPVIDLFDYLNQHGALSEAVARSIFRQIAEAVIHCHANGVVHRDIKDENILLNLHTSEAKLIDFGCGTVMKDAPYTEFAGTPEFYPPEWFTHRRYFGRRVDAWSMGVLLYTMVEAEVPFQKENDIVECKLRHKRAARLSDSCLHLIRWMLQKDQNMRPTIQQALTHPWFQQQSSVEATTTTQPPIFTPVSRGVMDTDELYEKHLRLHQNGRAIQPPVGIGISSAPGNKQQNSTHSVACTDSPQSPPRKHEQSTIDFNQRQGSNYHAQQRPPNARGY